MQVTTPDGAERMRLALLAFLDDAGSFVNESGVQPTAESILAREQAKSDAVQLDAAGKQGHLLLESAFDHVFALTRLMVTPVPTIAPWTCVRGGLEAAAIACWLLAHDIGAEERIGRSLAYRFEGLSQQVSLARATGSESERLKAEKRIEDVEAKALAMGYARVVSRTGRRDGIAQRMPRITALVGGVMGEEPLYRILSAIAHGHSFALIQLGFHAPDASQPLVREKALNSDAAAILLVTAADIVAKPLWAESALLGRNMEGLEALLTRHYRELGLSVERQFWRGESPR